MSNLPTYSYQPLKSVKPFLKTYSLVKARLLVGSFMLRAKEYGDKYNNLSFSFITQLQAGYFILHFKNELPTQQMLFNNLAYNELVKIENGTANLYRKNFFTNELTLLFSTPARKGVLTISQKLIVKLTDLSDQQFEPDLEIYPISEVSEIDPDTHATHTYWNVNPVITNIHTNSKWVECLTDGQDVNFPTLVSLPIFPFISLSPVENAKLAGGIGFPPLAEIDTGPTRSLIHINYAESDKGARMEISKVYEWKGESSTKGSWQPR